MIAGGGRIAGCTCNVPDVDTSPGGSRFLPVRDRLRALVDNGRVAGGVALVRQRDRVVFSDVFGFLDIEGGIEMQGDALFQVRSITKAVTAVAVMQLVERGQLRLDQPVSDVLPEFSERPVVERSGSATRPILIRDLLCHVSGLPHGWGDVVPRCRPGPWDEVSLADEVRAIAKLHLRSDPGTAFLYSDLGYSALGRVIEVAARTAYEDFVSQNILSPLEMKDSSFFPPLDVRHRVAVVYAMTDDGIERRDDEAVLDRKNPLPGAGLLSTAQDMASFHEMMLNGGAFGATRLLSSRTVNLMTTVQTGELPRWPSAGRSAGWGLGWSIADSSSELALYGASTGSYWSPAVSGSRCWVDPALGVVGVLMTHLFPHHARPWSQLWIGSEFTRLVTASVSVARG